LNPLGGPAKVFDAIADRIRAGDEYYAVLHDMGFVTQQEHEAKCAALEAAHKVLMGEAAHDVSEWGAYASPYFAEKWDLNGTIKKWLDRAEGEKK
jgi:hypothetical protein